VRKAYKKIGESTDIKNGGAHGLKFNGWRDMIVKNVTIQDSTLIWFRGARHYDDSFGNSTTR
jgi:hypothetical protein